MLQISNLTKTYLRKAVVDKVSFAIGPGEVLGYLGPNGSGKSTTVKMLTGLLEPTTGEITYQGRAIRDDLTGYKRKFGYVPEEPQLYGNDPESAGVLLPVPHSCAISLQFRRTYAPTGCSRPQVSATCATTSAACARRCWIAFVHVLFGAVVSWLLMDGHCGSGPRECKTLLATVPARVYVLRIRVRAVRRLDSHPAHASNLAFRVRRNLPGRDGTLPTQER